MLDGRWKPGQAAQVIGPLDASPPARERQLRMRSSRSDIGLSLVLAAGALLGGCRARGSDVAAGGGTADSTKASPTVTVPCASDNGGLILPTGFCATVFADSIGHARHLTVSTDGTVYVNTWSGEYYGKDKPHADGFLVALRETSGDGRADVIARFGDSVKSGGHGGTGIALYHGALYAESNDKILRYALPPGSITPNAAPDVIVDGLPLTGDHPMHPFAIDSSGGMYVDLGSVSNACQLKNRVARSPGHRPCTELETRGGIWRYEANQTGQHFSPNERYATGIRNAVGIAVDGSGHGVYSTQHGRDQLAENWPKLYTPVQGQNFPSEELLRIEKGADFGWPECYFDSTQVKLVLAPEYGGDGGKAIGPCATKQGPAAYFPAHWAPDALLFYNSSHFPASYGGGAFIAFHGSWNRAPGPQGGYNVVFVPFAGGKPTGQYEIFADGFAGAHKEPGKAAYRPSGLAVGPDGTLYISDDVHGRIWRVGYGGAAVPAPTAPAAPAPAATAESGPVSLSAAVKAAGITPARVALGDSVFHGQVAGGTCTACHGSDAKGTPLAPDLTDKKWLWSDGSYQSIVKTIREGVPAPKEHRGVMPPMGGAHLSAAQVAAVGGYVFALSHSAGS